MSVSTDRQLDIESHDDVAALIPAPSADRVARKEAKRLAKAATRARKRGEPSASSISEAGGGSDAAEVPTSVSGHSPAVSDRFKACDLCAARQPLLYRCQIDATRAWKFCCPSCWPSVSGGIADGNRETHPHYRYGGTWKFFKR
jgi:hypothetical protein